MSGRSARLQLQPHGSGESSTSGDGAADEAVAQILDPVARRVYELKLELGIAHDQFTPESGPLFDEDWDDE